MIESLMPVYEAYESLSGEAQTLAFAPRAIELQREVRERVSRFMEELARKKEEAVLASDERAANELLLLGTAMAMLQAELSMWITLKSDEGEAAWDHLVRAQSACDAAYRLRSRLFGEESARPFEKLASRYDAIEKAAFPPQVFCSPGGVAKRTCCSICDESYDECDHIVGRAYMGKFCGRIVKEFDVQEISLVSMPANKLCRVTHFTDGARRRNRMTWRIEGAVGNEDEAGSQRASSAVKATDGALQHGDTTDRPSAGR